jgi:hypothetical protein
MILGASLRGGVADVAIHFAAFSGRMDCFATLAMTAGENNNAL